MANVRKPVVDPLREPIQRVQPPTPQVTPQVTPQPEGDRVRRATGGPLIPESAQAPVPQAPTPEGTPAAGKSPPGTAPGVGTPAGKGGVGTATPMPGPDRNPPLSVGGGKGGPATPAAPTTTDTPNQSTIPMMPDPTVGAGFADPHVRPVAGVNPWQEWGANLLPGMVGPTQGETTASNWITQAVQQAQQGPTGAGLPGGPEGTSPTFEATRRAFEELTIPQIRQQRTLMGLGDSNAVTNDISRAWAGVLPTLVENELGREERGIERGVGALMGGAGSMAGLSAQEMARRNAASTLGYGFGTGFQQTADRANQAIYEDFLRRQGLAQQLLFAPLGQANVSVGQETQMGGLFK